MRFSTTVGVSLEAMPPSYLHREQELSDNLPVLQLQKALDRYREWKPDKAQQEDDKGMEMTRLCVLWATTFHLNDKSKAICLDD